MADTPFDFDFINENFTLEGDYKSYEVMNNGHINSTYVLTFACGEKEHRYVLQQINTNIFKDVDSLMNNIVGVTQHLRNAIIKNGGDEKRETLNFIPTKSGKYYCVDSRGASWRLYHHVGDVYTCNQIDSEDVFYNSGKAFGSFQKSLADYPIDTLVETIPNFHNTFSRFNDLKKAIAENKAGRRDNVSAEIEFALNREADTKVLTALIDEGKLPLRVTHNDTKLNNILFDDKTNEGICIIDLDTVMPGLSLYDFGDSIRFGANTASEDEKDVSKVSLSLPLYEAYVKGYLSTAKESLTDCEIEYLPFSAKMMTYECGIRFLTDYLNGDTYFKTAYPEHNLVRCRTQLALVADIEKKMNEMKKITMDAAK
ncbi:MAG: aminoglycoside phosphotransferase family protein [Oscillospiraceae bacterium]